MLALQDARLLTAFALALLCAEAAVAAWLFFIARPSALKGAARVRAALAEMRSRQVGEFLSSVLFQLREYLVSINSVTESIALHAPKENKELDLRVDKLRRLVAELNQKTGRLLGETTPITTGRSESAAIDVGRLLSLVAADAEADCGGAAEVSVEAEPGVSARIELTSVRACLLALMQNACEAARRGGGHVRVVARRAEGFAEIEVIDDGGGLKAGEDARLFEPLFSARAAAGGLGLGLAMSRRMIERLGGTLALRSRDGKTSALLRIPLEPALPLVRNEESTWANRRDRA